MKHLVFFLLLLLQSTSWTQMKVSKHAQLSYNKFSHEFFVMDDSTHYWTQKPGSKKWDIHPMVSQLDIPFQQLLMTTRVVVVNKNKYFFVNEGCGTVYALKNDTLSRIDRSFPHYNQFGAPMFVYNGGVFMFGGYGFFQVKNTFTRYVPHSKEWYQVNTHSKENPPPRSSPLFLYEKDDFFLLGGINRNKLKEYSLRDVWVYHCKKKTWECLGDLSEIMQMKFKSMERSCHVPANVVRMANQLMELNIQANKCVIYENPLVLSMQKVVASKGNKYLLYALSHHLDDQHEIVVQSFDQLKEFKVGEFPIFHKASIFSSFPREDYLWLSMFINLFLFGLLFYIRRMHKLKIFQRSSKKLMKVDFSSTEWEIICLIQRHGEMELSALNEYFNEGGLSYETLKKRRETFVKNIRIKIALITRKPMDEILVETKHNIDKRMKIIHWNSDIELEMNANDASE